MAGNKAASKMWGISFCFFLKDCSPTHFFSRCFSLRPSYSEQEKAWDREAAEQQCQSSIRGRDKKAQGLHWLSSLAVSPFCFPLSLPLSSYSVTNTLLWLFFLFSVFSTFHFPLSHLSPPLPCLSLSLCLLCYSSIFAHWLCNGTCGSADPGWI